MVQHLWAQPTTVFNLLIRSSPYTAAACVTFTAFEAKLLGQKEFHTHNLENFAEVKSFKFEENIRND